MSHIGVKIEMKYENAYLKHLVIIYRGIETQMVIIITSGVKHVIKINICTVKVNKDNKI
jgi:hypothetical protein